MSDVESILKKLPTLDREETKLIGQAVLEHLEELDDIAAYDSAKSKDEEVEALEVILARYAKDSSS